MTARDGIRSAQRVNIDGQESHSDHPLFSPCEVPYFRTRLCLVQEIGLRVLGKLSLRAFINCHKMTAMPMTSLNISLPEALKAYVEGQVASGDWGTPSEYIRELIRQDKERRLASLEQSLLAAAKGRTIEVPLAEIRNNGLLTALRKRAPRR